MQLIKFFLFIFSVILTIDFLVDTIEVMSGRSINHIKSGEIKPDNRYQLLVIIFWTLFYIFNEIPDG